MYDLKEKVVKSTLSVQAGDGLNTRADDEMTPCTSTTRGRDPHRRRAAAADREGAKSCCWDTSATSAVDRRALRIDATSGRITDDAEAMKLWQREYAPGWAPAV